MDVKSMLSEKGNKLIVINNFKFSKAHISKCGKIRWRCVNRKCMAKIFTAEDELTVTETYFLHNHKEDPTIPRQAISNVLKRKVLDDITERLSKIINMELKVSTF